MSKKERQLTAQEERRKKFFDKKVREMEEQGYVKTDLTVSVLSANVMAIVLMLPIVILVHLLFYYVNPGMSVYFSAGDTLIGIGILLALIVIHEGIHGLVWGLYSKEGFRAIEFGMIWSMLTPYCTCNEQLKKKQYIIGAAMPTVVLGVLPAIVAIITGNVGVLLIALIMILSGGGDAFIMLKLIKYREHTSDAVYLDHPYECGVVVFEKQK